MNIKIHDLTWDIQFSEDLESNIPDAESLCGLTFKSKQTIFISLKQSNELIKRTITHELTHAYIWSWGLENSSPFNEEQLCNFIETHASDILEQSNKIYKYYIEKIEEKAKK